MADVLPLRTDRLVLRLHAMSDLPALLAIYAQPEVARYLLDDPWTEAKAAEQLALRTTRTDLDGETGAVALVIEHNDQPIGDVALWFTDRERRVAEIGWVLDPAHGGRGLAREAVRAVLNLAFDHYRAHRVVANMDARNTASAKLAAALGMQHEASFRQDYWSKGERTDSLIYALLSTDPRS